MPKVKLLWHVGPESLPEEKNEYEYEDEYEKKHDFMRILDLKIVLVLLTTPPFGHPSNGGNSQIGAIDLLYKALTIDN
jgi:hypothetical protein